MSIRLRHAWRVACARRAGARGRLEFLPSPVRAAVRDLARRQAAERADREGHQRRAEGRLHLSGTLQIAPNNITPAVADGVVQMADDLFNSGNIPVAGIPRLPGLVRSYEDFAKCADVLRPYLVKAFADKGIVMLGDYTYPLQVIWGRKKLTCSTTSRA